VANDGDAGGASATPTWRTTATPAGRRTTPGGWARASVSTRLDDLRQSLRDAALAVTLALMRRAHCFLTLSDALRGNIARGPPSLFRLSVQLRAVVGDSYVMRSMEHSDSPPAAGFAPTPDAGGPTVITGLATVGSTGPSTLLAAHSYTVSSPSAGPAGVGTSCSTPP